MAATITVVKRFASSLNKNDPSLLETFSQIIKGQIPKVARSPIQRPSSALQRAPEFDAEYIVDPSRQNNASQLSHFNSGDMYVPADLRVFAEGKLKEVASDPFIITRKKVDIFKRNRCSLSQVHLNVRMLGSSVSPLGQILPRSKTGYSGKTQRNMAKAIKRARHMGLIPYMKRLDYKF